MQKKWQESRNYRRFRDENGEVVRRIITVDGVDVEVSEEVFLAYSQADRRERYITEEVEPGLVLSLDKLLEDGVPLEKLGVEPIESAEDTTIALEDKAEFDLLLSILPSVLTELSEADKALVEALYFKNMSTREYAKRQGVSQRAIIKRRDRIFRSLEKKLKNF